MHSGACGTLQVHASADWMLGHHRSRVPQTPQWCTILGGRTALVHHAIVMSPGVGDVTGTIARAMTNGAMTVPANIAGLAQTVPANNVDPHLLTGTAAPIWRTFNVTPANVSGTLPNTVTC